MRWKVTFEVDAPDEMTAEDIAGVFDDALADECVNNREDPTHPEFWGSEAKVELLAE